MGKLIKEHKKIAIGIGIFISILLVIYLGFAVYFMNHFYFGSEINGISVAGKSVRKVNEQMAAKLQAYILEIKGTDENSEQITADEVGLRYNSEGDFKKLKETQNPFKWISALFSGEATKMTEGIKYDEKLLKERVGKLQSVNSSDVIEPKNAGFKYVDNAYVIIDGVPGNKIDKEALYNRVAEAVIKKENLLDLGAVECFVRAEYTSQSQKVIEVRDMLNKFVSSKITYTFGNQKETLDGAKINNWLTVDEKYKIIFDEDKVKEYIDELASTYNTIGRKRSFVTSKGNTINIGGGDYGWSFNKAKETEALITAIKEGKTITKEPAYTQTALARGDNDIGSTYVEIDLTNQYLWFYKDGALLVEGNIVTGNVSQNNTTPPGIFRLKYKQKNAVLRGPGYAAPVTFWMPFNGGIGIHDASWRSKFGGTIYKTDGSHGCINSPYNVAKIIYENIRTGDPIVCY